MCRRRTDGGWPVALALLGATLLAAGCNTAPATDGAAALRAQEFREQLTETTTAINDGDLATAREHLEQAGARAATEQEQAKVASLDKLITGAEALMQGDPVAATTEWSDIADPGLNQQVRERASRMGMSVPLARAESEVAQ